MADRTFWQRLIEGAWRRRSVVWLMGVRRAGKTHLCRSLPSIEYFDCALPRVRRQLEDPEAFLDGMRGRRIVLDEIHRLADGLKHLPVASNYRSSHVSRPLLEVGTRQCNASIRLSGGLARSKLLRVRDHPTQHSTDFLVTFLKLFVLIRG